MEAEYNKFIADGWIDLGGGFILAPHPEHRAAYAGAHWTQKLHLVVLDALAAKPDFLFGPECFFGPGPAGGKLLAEVGVVSAATIFPVLNQTYFPELIEHPITITDPEGYPYETSEFDPAMTAVSFDELVAKLRGFLPVTRKGKVKLVSSGARIEFMLRQMINPPSGKLCAGRPMTVDERVQYTLEKHLDRLIEFSLGRAALSRFMAYIVNDSLLPGDPYEWGGLDHLDVTFLAALERAAARRLVYLGAPTEIRLYDAATETLGSSANAVPMPITQRLSDVLRLHGLTSVPFPEIADCQGVLDLVQLPKRPRKGRRPKLTPEQRREAWDALETGATVSSLALKYGVGLATIDRVRQQMEASKDSYEITPEMQMQSGLVKAQCSYVLQQFASGAADADLAGLTDNDAIALVLRAWLEGKLSPAREAAWLLDNLELAPFKWQDEAKFAKAVRRHTQNLEQPQAA